MIVSQGMCVCGKPLHYGNERARQAIEEQIRQYGETVKVYFQNRCWEVPRHYIALHGLKAHDLPLVAGLYNFEEHSITSEEEYLTMKPGREK